VKSKLYDRLYSIEAGNLDYLNKEVQESFVFQGSKNWDLYFFKRPNINDFEIYTNVKLLNFNLSEEKRFENYFSNSMIDYSIEHIDEKNINSYFILESNE